MSETHTPGEKSQRGIACYNAGKFAEAVKFFEEALRAGEDDAGTRRFLAHAYASLGRTDEAVRQLREAFRLGSDPSAVFDVLRMIMGRAAQFGPVEESLKLAAEKSPQSSEMRLILGGLYFEQGRLEDAEKHLRAAVRVDKGTQQARLLLGRVLEARGRMDEAEKVYRQAVKGAPKSADVRLRLGEFFLQSARWDEAEAVLREAVSLDDSMIQGFLLLGRSLEAQSKSVEAEECYASAARLKPRSFEPSLRLGEFYMGQGKYDEAAKHFSDAMHKDASTSKPCTRLAELHVAKGRLEAAAETLKDGAKKWPDDPELFFRLAWILHELGRFGPMRDSFNQYLRLERKEEYAKRFLAAVAVENYELAKQEGEAALDNIKVLFGDRYFHPWVDDWFPPRPAEYYQAQLKKVELWSSKAGPNPWARYFRALLLSHLDREIESLAEFDKLKASSGERYGWMRYAAGVRRLMMCRYEEATEDFKTASESRWDVWIARSHLAEAYLCLGRTPEAFQEFHAAESVCDVKGVSYVRAWRGECLLWLGRYQETVDECSRAISGGSTFALCWRGAAHMLLGNTDSARQDLDRAAVGGTRDAEVFLWRGELMRRLGDMKSALKDLNLSLEYGGGTWAWVNRALVFAQRGEWGAMWEDVERLPTSLFDFDTADPKGGLRDLDESKIVRSLEKALSCAAGVRRPEPYVEGIWRNLRLWEQGNGKAGKSKR